MAAFQGPPVERLFELGAFRAGVVLGESAGGVWTAHRGACGSQVGPGDVESPSPLPGHAAVEGVWRVQRGASRVWGDGGQAGGGACLQTCWLDAALPALISGVLVVCRLAGELFTIFTLPPWNARPKFGRRRDGRLWAAALSAVWAHGLCIPADVRDAGLQPPGSVSFQRLNLQPVLAASLGPEDFWVGVAECEDGIQAALQCFSSEMSSVGETRWAADVVQFLL